ncbi:late competence development ComFB family protein [Gloeocapsa sp. PCC 73106]|uniref:late competence development ComFB family protein n=1 Tax=Gloeocapsa sp. PCC 73106 TaxID=102232 RepID=UPI0002AD0701|nr:late competence development ComFB family protein [Gloeocapsa sp. PCC 73106]ELR97444.1 Late competence development protein ComFB [Gloeocapsa sp. PCC 73106]
MNNSNPQVIRNVMEVLVAEEVARQICYHSESVTRQINSLEIISYALNRLPSLYASSEEGFTYQKLKGELILKTKIEATVKEAFAAIFQEPYRSFRPLTELKPKETKEERQIKHILSELTTILPNKDASFVLKIFKQIIMKIMQDELTEAEIHKLRLELSFDWEDTRYRL